MREIPDLQDGFLHSKVPRAIWGTGIQDENVLQTRQASNRNNLCITNLLPHPCVHASYDVVEEADVQLLVEVEEFWSLFRQSCHLSKRSLNHLEIENQHYLDEIQRCCFLTKQMGGFEIHIEVRSKSCDKEYTYISNLHVSLRHWGKPLLPVSRVVGSKVFHTFKNRPKDIPTARTYVFYSS